MMPVTDNKKVINTTIFENSQDQLLAGLTAVDLRVRWAIARARMGGLDANDEFRGLYISDVQVDTLLGYEFGQNLWTQRGDNGASSSVGQNDWQHVIGTAFQVWRIRTEASRRSGIHMRLDHLIDEFGLSEQEVIVLLIALAPELDLRYEHFYAYLQDNVTKKRPSIDLILNLLADSFREKLELRQIFALSGRLLHSRLLYRFTESNEREATLLTHYIRPAANVVEYLLGGMAVSNQLANCVQLTNCTHLITQSTPITSRRKKSAFLDQLSHLNQPYEGKQPLFAFKGVYGVGKREAAHYLATASDCYLLTVDMAALMKFEGGLMAGLELVARDGRLHQAHLYLTNWDKLIEEDSLLQPVLKSLFNYPHTIIAASTKEWYPRNARRRRPVYSINFQSPDYRQRLHIWQANIPSPNLNLNHISNQFNFTQGQIEDAAASAHDIALQRQTPLTEADIFRASRAHSNQKLATLASKIQPHYQWDDIVLPNDTMSQLKEMANMVRHKPVVYGQWGFERKQALGKGLNVLFSGESGTGKTMAADIMANVLQLDLYKIDLSRLVSKYIGETEKNLDRIFTEARTSNAVLFFDEADAIFGKRSEVKDSHDRHANVEISYLLQRMESYDGIVILATNMRANLDEAFTRRMHFITHFPYPEAEDRERIWRVNLPDDMPLAGNVDIKWLADRFRLSGGNIRNIILAAAFLAANTQDQIVEMAHLLHAVRREYQKMGRLLDNEMFKR